MKTVILRIEEDDKAMDLLRVLRDISYVQVEEKENVPTKAQEKTAKLGEMCGLWKGRSLTLEDLRAGAWGHRGVPNDTD